MSLKILIIKHGALGDVVRTSYFIEPLKKKWVDSLIFWKTEENARDILQNVPGLDRLSTSWSDLLEINFDIVYSLDDEMEVLSWVSKLSTNKLVGAYIDSNNRALYTENSSLWFDMGLRSKFGKEIADNLKLNNKKGHGEIFKAIFDVSEVEPKFYLDNEHYELKEQLKGHDFFKIGINPYAGGRWPSKELQPIELQNLIKILLKNTPYSTKIYLFGGGNDRDRNYAVCEKYQTNRLIALDTNKSIQILAAHIGSMNIFITSDSLAMHLSIAQKIKTLAFFSPTSAAEIDDFGIARKLISTHEDYCSYSPNADNSSITAERILYSISDWI